MRFKLEKEDIPQKHCSNAPRYVTTTQIRVNDKTAFSLPSISYIIIEQSINQNLKILDLNYNVASVLSDLSQGLKLKLESVGNDYKLALVTTSDEPYYYYDDGKDTIIATIDHIPKNYTNGIYVYTYSPNRCSANYELLENRKVLIDPKDIISSKNINLILQDLQNLPNKRLTIQPGDYFFEKSQYVYRYYKSAQVHDPTGSKVGMLNNVVPEFDRRDNNFKLFPFHEIKNLKAQDSYFTAKKLGNNYVGCISYENSTCKNFYPDSFGYEHNNSPGPYPHYYNLENFGNFLEVDMNTKEYIDLEERIKALESNIERLERAGVQGPKGEPGRNGESGLKGDKGEQGLPGPQGNKGDTGASGAHGSKGEPGVQGPPGFKGERGEKGQQGLRGASGTKGEKGWKGERATADEVAAKVIESDTFIQKVLLKRIIDVEDFTRTPRPLAETVKEKLKQDSQFTNNIKGEQGLPGPQGNKGDTGASGAHGSKGEPGVQGPPGFKGERGEKGQQGLRGASGTKGEKGLRGWKGDIGPKGVDGIRGLKGDTGEKGNTGTPGPKGLKGIDGLQGIQGLTGSKGIDGLKGDIGPIGPQGNKGKLGVQGPVGPKGEDGLPGIKGEPGMRGFNGTQGLPGNKGELGAPGLKGIDGLQGQKGEPGVQGPIGPKGDQGLPGTDGLPGPIGLKGEPGIDGAAGIKGDKGAKGINGTSGSKGEKGDNGMPGSKGDMGNKGNIGLPGLPGPKGIDANPEEVAQKLINNGTIANQVLEYRNQDGDLVLEQQIAGRLIHDQNIHAGIATELIDNKAQELADALLSDANNTLVEKLANNAELTQSISEELRKNPGEVQGPKGDIGASGTDGLPGAQGPKGSDGVQGISGPKGDKGVDGAPGIDGLPGPKGNMGDQGLQGQKGEPGIDGLKGDIGPVGLIGLPGLRGFNGTQGLSGNKGELGAPGLKGDIGLPGAQGNKGDTGSSGTHGSKGEPGVQGLVGPKGADGVQGISGPKGDKGNIGLQGPKGQAGRSGLKGSKGNTGLIGMPGPKGEDGIGADVANQLLREINQTRTEIRGTKEATEAAKNASEGFATQAKAFKEEADSFADQALQSANNAQAFHGSVRDMFCITNPADQICGAGRRRRETKKSSVTSGASRPTSFISQVINFFYPVVGQDEYKVKNEIQELNRVEKIIDAVDIVTKFEEVLGATAVTCGIPKKSLNFDPMELQSTIILSNDENHNELLKLLCVTAKKSFPNYKQTSKCLTTFKDHMEKRLKDNGQQRAFVNTEKIVADNEQPRSFMSYVSPPSSLSTINQKVVGYLR